MAESPAGDVSPPSDEHNPTPAGLPFQSLYRRFRPQRFADVKGQDHVTRALLNSVRDGRIAHAYLFSGPRGTGEDIDRRILAMALNCDNPVDGEPDGTCASCIDIRKGSSTDVQELDAASNRRIDEMRDLVSRVALGTRGRWKVYIIDEVHQLTGDAASALLKTLEEPPAHVVFVLATTDPQKVLPTIRSRTIHFDFHLLPSEVLGDLLRDINEQAHLGVPPEAIDLVIRRGHGSARDALTVLDQVAAGGGVEDRSEVVGQIVEGLAERDTGLVLTAVAEGMAAGRDARRLAADLLEHLRNGFLATMARGLVMLPDDAIMELAEQARRLGLAALVRGMEVIGQALADMRDSVDPRVTLEVALVRLSRPDADISPAALLERIERLERAAREGGQAGSGAGPIPRTDRRSGGYAGQGPAPGGSAPAGSGSGRAPSLPPPSPAPLGSDRASSLPPPSPPLVPPPRSSSGSGSGRAPSLPPPSPAPSGSDRAPSLPPPSPAPLGSDRAPSLLPPPASLPTPAPTPSGSDAAPPLSPPPVPPRSAAGRAPAPPVPVGPKRAAAAPPTTLPSPPADAPTGSRAGPGLALPSRDDLSKAWGDGVLRSLTPKAKVFLANGRFVSVDPDGAVFALPNQQLLSRSRDARSEAEAALAARFGRPVPLKLVVESALLPTGADPVLADDEQDYGDLDHLQDADVAVISPEQRLMDAFPGAEEVST